MDVVEAINTWIDEEIDELTDDELESILDILDAVSASDFADFDTDQIYDEDIDELVDLHGGSEDQRSFTRRTLNAAVFGDDFFLADDRDGDIEVDDIDDDDSAVDATAELEAEPDVDHPVETDSDIDVQADIDVEVEVEDELPVISLGDGGEPEMGNDDHSNFLSDLAAVESAAATPTVSEVVEPSVPLVELRDGDALGPSFLDPPLTPLPKKKGSLRQYVLGAFMLAGLAAFAFGTLQLINSLDEEDAEVAASGTDSTPEPQAEPTATPLPKPTATPEPTLVPGAPTPTPTPEPTPPPRLGVRLTSGDVMLATFDEGGEPPTFDLIYDSSDDDLNDVIEVAWLNDLIGVVDDDGDILVIDPDARRPEPELIYEAGGGLSEAVELASSLARIAVRTADGDVTLIPPDGRADPDVINFVWDASEEGIEATDITSVGDLVPFVLENGDARMVVGSADDQLATIWSADDQPPAVNTAASSSGILLGVGQGAVARYELGELSEGAPRITTVWDPFETEETPAIGYSTADSRTAVVLADGAIVMADETGTGEKIWDPAETELRALSVAGSATQLVVLLETGSIVIVPLDQNGVIESIWDITDETLSAAAQVSIEQLGE